MLRISGYGQTGPYKGRPGFGVVAEVLLALQHRHASVSAKAPKGRSQVIDVALYEAVFNGMESLLPEYSARWSSALPQPLVWCSTQRWDYSCAPSAPPAARFRSRNGANNQERMPTTSV